MIDGLRSAFFESFRQKFYFSSIRQFSFSVFLFSFWFKLNLIYSDLEIILPSVSIAFIVYLALCGDISNIFLVFSTSVICLVAYRTPDRAT